ncbi:ABC transporter ATP-binding protein [Salipiger mucosus]|uniref:Oligopeptide transport ATP-binding protein OppF n=1 Tax=Salipiger mucosus DSM 16094 TaxID=1123237 RepID=S9SB38_9RHOB|nr:oligopeptide/dipeptide ABC transporter ATP-binding protein [Salipiger mucosus]EPX83454.1 Oligopeptide transport ATP-binding protein OppF [Salipiger mucosus DSM 16094]
MTALLHAESLRKSYQVGRRSLFRKARRFNAVDGVSLTLERGETLGIVGESGCGKSTLSRLVLGLSPCDEGGVVFDGTPLPGQDTEAWRRLRRRVQLIYQDAAGALDPRQTIRTQIEEPLRIHGLPLERAQKAMADVGLVPAMGSRHPFELSGGQLQRVVIARALTLNPDLIVMDEPVSALDVSIQAQIVNLIQDLQRDRGLAYLFVTHDLSVLRHVSDRVAVMYLGEVVEEAPRDAFFDGALHPYARALLEAVPVPDPARRSRAAPRIGDPPNPAAPPPACRFHPRCPFATDVCRAERPALRDFGGRRAACHRVEELSQ